MQLSDSFSKSRKLVDLVENQTSYELQDSAMHIFETHTRAERVLLQFTTPVLASMFQGKKVMHLRERDPFEFLPGESLILPADEMMCIDFPEARMDNPTKCLAMEIGEDSIRSIVQIMNEQMGKVDGGEWQLMDYNFHFTNDPGIYQILQRLVYLYTENHPSKDFFVTNMVKELVIRILQANALKTYEENTSELAGSHRFAYVIEYIRSNLHFPISIQELSQKSCMSESNFYRKFKQELGMSPVDFINKERIKKASELLRDERCNLTEVFLACGFKNRSYFNRMFKRVTGMSPNSYRQRFTNTS